MKSAICAIVLNVAIGASSPTLQEGMHPNQNHTRVNFVRPIEGSNVPSKVGFYNKDMDNYLQAIEKAYPNDTDGQRYEHLIQDTIMQTLISTTLGETETLFEKREKALKTYNSWKSIAYLGFNSSMTENNVPRLSKEELVDKVAKIRTGRYVELINDHSFIDYFSNSRDKYVQSIVLRKHSDGGCDFVQKNLDQTYNAMSGKVFIDDQTQWLQKETRLYQGAIAAVAAMAAVATGICAYLCSMSSR